MAISLAEKLGPKHGLTAFSLHPGVISTNLGAHLDFSVDIAELSKFCEATNCMFGI
jgi:hypothetical protein